KSVTRRRIIRSICVSIEVEADMSIQVIHAIGVGAERIGTVWLGYHEVYRSRSSLLDTFLRLGTISAGLSPRKVNFFDLILDGSGVKGIHGRVCRPAVT